MEEPVLEAEGIDCQVELLRDGVRIRRKGLLAKAMGGDKEISYRQLASLKFKSRSNGGYIYFVLAGQEENQGWLRPREYQVNFSVNQREQFEAIKQAIEQRIAEGQRPPEVSQVSEQPKAHPQEPPEESTSWANADHNVDLIFEGAGSLTLGGRVKNYIEKNINPGESVEFYIVGEDQQTMVALQDRLLVVKCGLLAGATFGCRVTSFYYRDINGIEVNAGLLTSVIEVNTPSYQGTQEKDFWNLGSTKNPDKDPFRISNCIPITKWSLKKQKPQLDRLREKVREAKLDRTVPSHAAFASSGSGIAAELEKLASLRESGILTDEEFQQAKKKLLG